MNERLVVFMYTLMRDHLPTGTVAKIVQDIEGMSNPDIPSDYTNEHLESYSRELVSRLDSRPKSW